MFHCITSRIIASAAVAGVCEVLRWCDEHVSMSVCMSVCLSACLSVCSHSHKPHVETSFRHVFTVAVAWSASDDSSVAGLCTSCIVNDVVFAYKRPGKDDANRTCTQSDSPGLEPGAKCDVDDCPLWNTSFKFSCEGLQRYSGIDMVKMWIGQKRLGTATGLTGFDMRSFSGVDQREPFGFLVQDRLTILILFCHPTNNIKSHWWLKVS